MKKKIFSNKNDNNIFFDKEKNIDLSIKKMKEKTLKKRFK